MCIRDSPCPLYSPPALLSTPSRDAGTQAQDCFGVQDLVLDKVSSPIGVVLIIFEARPDALPQIASLAIRSGNGLILKGGKEAAKTNACLHNVITSCLPPACEPELIGLVTSRGEIDELLAMKEYIDLVVPRGSNALVSYIQNNTSIPVLGHADGICHIYVDENVDIASVRPVSACSSPAAPRCSAACRCAASPPCAERACLAQVLLWPRRSLPADERAARLQACKICVDAKVDYPAACNAVEKILVHRAHERNGNIFKLQTALRDAGVAVNGTDATTVLLAVPEAPSLRHEYGTLEVTMDLVESMQEAIDKIHTLGSGHTEVRPNLPPSSLLSLSVP